MKNPGSSHAVVLPGSQQIPDLDPPAVRAIQLLKPFLDATRYTAIAIVHGREELAPSAFDLAKLCMKKGNGVVWLPDPELLPLLEGPHAEALQAMLLPRPNALMTFASVKRQDVRQALSADLSLLRLQVRQGFVVAGLA